MALQTDRILPAFRVGQGVEIKQRTAGQDLIWGGGRVKKITARSVILDDGSRWRTDGYEWGKSEGQKNRRLARRIVPVLFVLHQSDGLYIQLVGGEVQLTRNSRAATRWETPEEAMGFVRDEMPKQADKWSPIPWSEKDLVAEPSEESSAVLDYDRREKSAGEKESVRLKKLADELQATLERLRELQDELAFTPAAQKLVAREFRTLYEAKRAEKDLETAAVKLGNVIGIVHGGVRIIETYES